MKIGKYLHLTKNKWLDTIPIQTKFNKNALSNLFHQIILEEDLPKNIKLQIPYYKENKEEVW